MGVVERPQRPERTKPQDDLAALVEEARADLAAAAELGPFRRDPYGVVLSSHSKMIEVFGKAVSDVIAARDPLPPEDREAMVRELVAATQQGAYEGMRKEAQRVVRTIDSRLVVQITLGVLGGIRRRSFVRVGLHLVPRIVKAHAVITCHNLRPSSRRAETRPSQRHIGANTMTRVLLIGIKPEAVDFSDPDLPPGTTAEKIAGGINATLSDMKARGWDAAFCSILTDDSVEATIAASFAEHWDCVVIGGGVRIPSRGLRLFERVINAVHRGAPKTPIAFKHFPKRHRRCRGEMGVNGR